MRENSKVMGFSLLSRHLFSAQTVYLQVGESGGLVRTTAQCDGTDSTCPWLWGDAAWLVAGVVRGLVGFAVDLGSGACEHDNLGDEIARTIDEETDEFASTR